MKKILYFFYFIPLFLSAQVNESDTLNLKVSLALTGFWQGGNVEAFVFRAKSDLRFKPWQKWVFQSTNSYVYQEFGKKKADEDILSLNFLSFHPERKIYPLLLGFVSTNFRREIDLRYLLGAGATFRILNNKDQWLKCSLTSEYEKTDFSKSVFIRSEYDGNHIINTVRATLWINGKYQLFNKKAILTHESYFQPSLERSNNYRWRADVGLELPVWQFLNFKINYLHTFESIVIANQKQSDNFLTFGFTVKNY